MPSGGGKYKLFSTCGSHLSIVSLFNGTAIVVYIKSAVNGSFQKTSLASIMYILIPQVMNPFIYNLRNSDLQGALRKPVSKMPSFLYCAIYLRLSF